VALVEAVSIPVPDEAVPQQVSVVGRHQPPPALQTGEGRLDVAEAQLAGHYPLLGVLLAAILGQLGVAQAVGES
jgi:hypothetical protein